MIKGLPNINMPRVKHAYHMDASGTCDGGEFIPFHWEEILPGVAHERMKLSYVIRQLGPSNPVLDTARVRFLSVFVPYRIIWNQFKAFMGENDTTYWTQPITYTEPTVNWFTGSAGSNAYACTIGDYLGLPLVAKGQTVPFGGKIKVSALPLRAVLATWNYWVRDENTMSAHVFSKESTAINNSEGSSEGWNDDVENAYYNAVPLPATRVGSYYSYALPQPQKGLPQAAFGPVGTLGEESYNEWLKLTGISNLASTSSVLFRNRETPQAGIITSAEIGLNADGDLAYAQASQAIEQSQDFATPTNLWAAISVENIRKASFMQRVLEILGSRGSRYSSEFLKSIFGISNSESLLSEPELLGTFERLINMTEVMSNADTADSSDPDIGRGLGVNGAYSKTTGNDGFYSHVFSEHGILLYGFFIRHDDHFSQGLERKWRRFSFWDHYLPQAQGLGYQKLYKRELNVAGTGNDDTLDSQVFGYRPYGSDYLNRPSRVCGYLNPIVDDALKTWNYAQVLPQSPVLNSAFQSADKSGFARVSLFKDTLDEYRGMQFFFDIAVDGVEITPVMASEFPGMTRI